MGRAELSAQADRLITVLHQTSDSLTLDSQLGMILYYNWGLHQHQCYFLHSLVLGLSLLYNLHSSQHLQSPESMSEMVEQMLVISVQCTSGWIWCSVQLVQQISTLGTHSFERAWKKRALPLLSARGSSGHYKNPGEKKSKHSS